MRPESAVRVAAVRVNAGRVLAVSLLAVSLLSLTPAFAPAAPQGSWSTQFGFPDPGVDGSVSCALVWNGDLVIAGDFTTVGDAPANGMARFDGTAWRAMDQGLGAAFSLVEFEGDLFAAGSVAGGPAGIIRWNGHEWESVGGSGIAGWLRIVRRIVAWNGSLVICGSFTSVDGVPCVNAARWDGSQWHAMGSELTSTVDAIVEHEGDLYAAGWYFVRRWNGSAWTDVAPGAQGHIYQLASHDGRLIATGSFWSMGGPGSVMNIASYDGAGWASLGAGLDAWAEALFSIGSDLYVGGGFAAAGGIATPCAARWDGAAWHALGAGCSAPVAVFAFYDGAIIAGGSFDRAGEVDCGALARWDGSVWSVFVPESGEGLDATVRTIAAHEGAIVAAGEFTRAGGIELQGIARWNGSEWQDIGTVLPYSERVWSFLSWNGSLYAGGGFSHIGGQPVPYLARYDGATWSPVGAELDGGVNAIAVYQGHLVAAGHFSLAGNAACERIAILEDDGWHALGTGLVLNDWWSGENIGYASALLAVGGDLYVGGCFETAGGVECANLARWDGSSWHPVGGGIGAAGTGEEVRALAWHEGILYAGGIFGTAGGVQAQNIASWDGIVWREIAGGVNSVVDCIVPYEDGIAIGGMFDYVDGAPGPACLIHWDGSQWSAYGDGIGGDNLRRVHGAVVLGGDLYVGGRFRTAGGRSSSYLARWISAISDAAEVLPADMAIRVPVPYRPGASIRLEGMREGLPDGAVFDAAGRRVASIGPAAGGASELRWDGRTSQGHSAPPGVYFLRVEEGSRSASARIVLVSD